MANCNPTNKWMRLRCTMDNDNKEDFAPFPNYDSPTNMSRLMSK